MNNSELLENSLDPRHVDFQMPPKFLPLFFEKTDTYPWKQFMMNNQWIPYAACAVYLICIFGLQSYMKHRAPIKARKALIAWNSFLAIFSMMGFFRIGQELFYNLGQPNGYYNTVCVSQGRNQPAEFWGLLFTLSKFIELGDTVFIVLRKQPLLALQWYHHCLVTVFAWKLFPWGEPILAYYATINFGVHMFMYSYFALKGLRVKVPNFVAMFITTIQILQMIINFGNNLYTIALIKSGYQCLRHPFSIKFSLGVYLSLWLLFAKFFADKYYSKSRAKKAQ